MQLQASTDTCQSFAYWFPVITLAVISSIMLILEALWLRARRKIKFLEREIKRLKAVTLK